MRAPVLEMASLFSLGSLAALAFLAALSGHCQAYHLRDGLYFSMPQDSVRSVDIWLPSDFGIISGKREFVITTETNWTDITVTEQIVRTDENNTVKIPVEFRSFGVGNGSCSPFTIRIESPDLGRTRNWSGGVCVSRQPDLDLAPSGQEDPGSVMAGNQDIFSVGFSSQNLLARPGGSVNVTVIAESYADMELEVRVSGEGVSFSPSVREISLDSENHMVSLLFGVSVPSSEGEYPIEVVASRGCVQSSCTRKAYGTITVLSEGNSPQSGFSASIFPESINVKELGPVGLRLSVYNYGNESRSFTAFMKGLDPGLRSDFYSGVLNVGPMSEEYLDFEVTPQEVSSYFEVEVEVGSKRENRTVTAVITTNEMMTDVMRRADSIKEGASGEVAGAVDSSLDSWYESYRSSDYGEEGEAWEDIQESLDAAASMKAAGSGGDGSGRGDPVVVPVGGNQQDGWLFYVLVAAAVAAGLFLIYYYVLRGRNSKEEEFAELVEQWR
jgi:hypothetical protein